MSRRTLLSLGFASIALFGSAFHVSAGGWAVTSLDEVPSRIEAGTPYQIGYTVRQHGQRPITLHDTTIVITSTETGETHKFAGRPDGPEGHHIAEVTFPSAGAWDWSVFQGMFGEQVLRAVDVVAASGAAAGSERASSGLLDFTIVRIVSSVAAVALIALFVFQLTGLRPERAVTVPAAGTQEPVPAGD